MEGRAQNEEDFCSGEVFQGQSHGTEKTKPGFALPLVCVLKGHLLPLCCPLLPFCYKEELYESVYITILRMVVVHNSIRGLLVNELHKRSS